MRKFTFKLMAKKAKSKAWTELCRRISNNRNVSGDFTVLSMNIIVRKGCISDLQYRPYLADDG